MTAKIARFVSVAAILLALAGARPAACQAWSLWNPFSSGEKRESKPRRPVYRTVAHQPSTWEKITAGPKHFFEKVGEALSLKKPPPKKHYAMPYAHPKYPGLTQPKQKESKSWFSSWFGSKEPEKPKTVGEWMKESKRVDLGSE